MFTEIKFAKGRQTHLKKAVWLTDLHLDAAGPSEHKALLEAIMALSPDFLLVGGDTSNGARSIKLLLQLAKFAKKKCYFVLGNHDYYYGSIRATRTLAKKAAKQSSSICYLTEEMFVELSPDTALIGHDGWCDGRSGDFFQSNIILNDYFLIDELKDISPPVRFAMLNRLGDDAATAIEKRLEKTENYPFVVVLTHTPPFREACRYQGHIADDNWAPHFVCQAMGDVLVKAAEKNPKRQILVLCGHSHHPADIHPAANLRVMAGQCELGSPEVQGIVYLK